LVVVVLLMVVDVDRSRAVVRRKILLVRFPRCLAWPCVFFQFTFLDGRSLFGWGGELGAKSGQPCYSAVMLMSEAKANSDLSGTV
jgi:hypothetical protein